LRYKKAKGIKFIFDMRDFWPDACREIKRFDVDNNVFHKAVYKFFKKKEKEFLEKADQIISLTEAGKRIMQAWCRDGTIKITAPITVIPCCADFSFFDPKRLDPDHVARVRRNLGLAPDDFVLNYLGSLGPTYLTDEMLDFYKVLVERRPNAKFLIVANNNHQIAQEAAVRKCLDPDKLIIIRAGKEEVPYLIAQSNLSVFFIMPSFAKQACSPTRLAELLAMNVPVISNTHVGDLDAILDLDENSSAIVTRFDKDEYERVIDRVLQRIDAKCPAIRENSSALSLTTGVKAYDHVYARLVNSRICP
jgi:glycosyltransferase involved in cell wall biosynthesis